MKIQTKVRKAKEKISALYAEIKSLQDICEHPGLMGRYGSNTGNWCPSDDGYWLELRCPCCDKRWEVDSEDPAYRTTKFIRVEKW